MTKKVKLKVNPLLAEAEPERIEGERWKIQEMRMAAGMGGRVQPGSGSSMYAKGDVKTSEFLIECKATDKASLSLKGDWLAKIREEARGQGLVPALALNISGEEWVAIPRSLFLDTFKE